MLLSWATTRFVPFKSGSPRSAPIGRFELYLCILFHHAIDDDDRVLHLPLHLANLMGFVLTLFGGLVLILSSFAFSWTAAGAGFPFLASVIAIFSGAQLFALGVIGEYLARMYFRTMERPTYSFVRRRPAPKT